jgi:hypothetical protein
MYGKSQGSDPVFAGPETLKGLRRAFEGRLAGDIVQAWVFPLGFIPQLRRCRPVDQRHFQPFDFLHRTASDALQVTVEPAIVSTTP